MFTIVDIIVGDLPLRGGHEFEARGVFIPQNISDSIRCNLFSKTVEAKGTSPSIPYPLVHLCFHPSSLQGRRVPHALGLAQAILDYY